MSEQKTSPYSSPLALRGPTYQVCAFFSGVQERAITPLPGETNLPRPRKPRPLKTSAGPRSGSPPGTTPNLKCLLIIGLSPASLTATSGLHTCGAMQVFGSFLPRQKGTIPDGPQEHTTLRLRDKTKQNKVRTKNVAVQLATGTERALLSVSAFFSGAQE